MIWHYIIWRIMTDYLIDHAQSCLNDPVWMKLSLARVLVKLSLARVLTHCSADDWSKEFYGWSIHGSPRLIYQGWSILSSRVVQRARLGGQTTTNVLVSALVSDCTNVFAKCRVYFRRFCYLNQVDFADLSGTIAENKCSSIGESHSLSNSLSHKLTLSQTHSHTHTLTHTHKHTQRHIDKHTNSKPRGSFNPEFLNKNLYMIIGV